MNTPKPCVNCGHLYVDCMQEDNPEYLAECKLGKVVKERKKCRKYVPWSGDPRLPLREKIKTWFAKTVCLFRGHEFYLDAGRRSGPANCLVCKRCGKVEPH